MDKEFITSESVAEGHPDKVCDQISDAVLDEVLKQDRFGRVACETYVTMGLIIIGGEISTSGYVDMHNLVRNVLKYIGYVDQKYGFDYKTCAILNAVHSQSPDIAQGVNKGGAGDQGIMLGYACNETPQFMPLPIILSHSLAKRMAEVRKRRILDYLGPDGKTQVTVEYHDGKPKRVDRVVLACQHTEDILDPNDKEVISQKAREEIIEAIAKPVLKDWIDENTAYYVNETGKFTVGGPQSDTGMTGRKIIVDTYGGIVAHGGGAFSGKDPSKVDRSASYMTRYIAKNIVASGVAEKCLIQLAYVIGKKEPISLMINTFGTEKISKEKIMELVRENFDLTPNGIIDTLNLLRPIYAKTACYGHFGRDEEGFSWEKLDKVDVFKKYLPN